MSEARRAADIAETAAREARAADLESRLRAALSISLAADNPLDIVATVKSVHPERLAEVTIGLLPIKDAEPSIGFRSKDDKSLSSVWTLHGLEPGEQAERPVVDLRPKSPSQVEVRWLVTDGGVSCSWTATVQINYPPHVYVF